MGPTTSGIFPSGRGPSIFPDWQSHIANGIFLSPEGDERSGRMQPQGKDIVVPGYRNISRVPSSLLERVRTSAETVRPTFLFFRGSTWSHRPGETNYGEGVRLTLQRALSTFQLPRHISVERSLSPLKVTPRLKKQRAIFSEDPVSLPLYLEEMSLSDFCLCPMGSTSWTLRMCDPPSLPPPPPLVRAVPQLGLRDRTSLHPPGYDAIFLGCIPGHHLGQHGAALRHAHRLVRDCDQVAAERRGAAAHLPPRHLADADSGQAGGTPGGTPQLCLVQLWRRLHTACRQRSRGAGHGGQRCASLSGGEIASALALAGPSTSRPPYPFG